MRLLAKLLEMHSTREPIRLWDLLESVYGSAVRLSDEQYLYYKQLEFLIESLVESGNALRKSKDNEDVMPTPKAITTLATYELEREKLRSTLWIGRCQLMLGVGMLAVAAATLYIKIFGE